MGGFGDQNRQRQGQGEGQGQHRGKGPKGFQRSDDRIKELICERLSEDPEIDPSDVTVTVSGGRVTLEGTVDSRRTKNAIEDIAEQFGVQDVQNNLRTQRTGLLGSLFGQSEKSGAGQSASGQTGSEAGGRGTSGSKTTGNDESSTKQKHN